MLLLTGYLGSSLAKKTCGLIMLPRQYERNNIALTVDFLAFPEMLDETIDMLVGRIEPNATMIDVPNNFAWIW
jgi:ABC-type uncharacterized transport system permease subunit